MQDSIPLCVLRVQDHTRNTYITLHYMRIHFVHKRLAYLCPISHFSYNAYYDGCLHMLCLKT